MTGLKKGPNEKIRLLSLVSLKMKHLSHTFSRQYLQICFGCEMYVKNTSGKQKDWNLFWLIHIHTPFIRNFGPFWPYLGIFEHFRLSERYEIYERLIETWSFWLKWGVYQVSTTNGSRDRDFGPFPVHRLDHKSLGTIEVISGIVKRMQTDFFAVLEITRVNCQNACNFMNS